MKEISIKEIENLDIGQVENAEAATGCTVFVSKNGMRAGLDVRGGGPASRESQLLMPLAAIKEIHAIVLSGGSAFGLGVANGVMECLEKRDIGYDVGITKVPLVAQADIFDLRIGDAFTRPDSTMGYKAATLALDNPNYQDGNYGVGCGATAGKALGMEFCTKTGIGSYAVQLGNLKIGAVVAVNAYGDIYNYKTGQQIAGMRNEDGKGFRSTVEHMKSSIKQVENKFVGNTTLAVLATNGDFDKTQLCKIAGMGHNGYARSIHPVHTSADGDSIYAVSVGNIKADIDLVGTIGADVISEAIIRAVESATSAYGIPASSDVNC